MAGATSRSKESCPRAEASCAVATPAPAEAGAGSTTGVLRDARFRGLLRMRTLRDAINDLPHPEGGPQGHVSKDAISICRPSPTRARWKNRERPLLHLPLVAFEDVIEVGRDRKGLSLCRE